MAKIAKIGSECIVFDNGYQLYSEHNQICCESHYLYFGDLILDGINDLEFDLSQPIENLIKKIPDYGIELIPTNGWPLRIPGYGSNNGYYSDKLTLVLEGDKTTTLDISECQEVS